MLRKTLLLAIFALMAVGGWVERDAIMSLDGPIPPPSCAPKACQPPL